MFFEFEQDSDSAAIFMKFQFWNDRYGYVYLSNMADV